MTYKEAEELVSNNKSLVGEPMINIYGEEINGKIVGLLICPSIHEFDKVFNYWWYDFNNDNVKAIAQLGKRYESFEVFAISYDGSLVVHAELNKYLERIKK